MKKAIQAVEQAFEEQAADYQRRLDARDEEIQRLRTINEALEDVSVLKPFLEKAEAKGESFDEWLVEALHMVVSQEKQAILVHSEIRAELLRVANLRSQSLSTLTLSKKTTAALKRMMDNWI